jgi:hypothetical protein
MKYQKDTLGYYHQMCLKMFGAKSMATKIVKKKAELSPAGFDDIVLTKEEQMIKELELMHYATPEHEQVINNDKVNYIELNA